MVVYHWATSCPPRQEELWELKFFHNGAEVKADVPGVTIEWKDGPGLRAFVDRQLLSYPIQPVGERPRRNQLIGSVVGLPTSYLVALDGESVARPVGPITAEAISAFIGRYETEHGGNHQ